MILRSIALRHGRRALAKPAVRSWKRCLASQVQPFRDQEHIEGGIGGSKSAAVLNSRAKTPPSRLASTDKVAQDYYALEQHKETFASIGSQVEPHYKPHTLLSNPIHPQHITLELLLASQSHLGHSTSLWNPANARYIFGVRQGIHIISLDVTASHLRRACAIVRGVTQRGGLVLFVGTRPGQDRAVVKAAQLAQGCHLFDHWIPGSITNGPQILGGCRLKVVDEFDREIKGFEDQLAKKGSLKPDLVVCLNPLENYVLLHECGLNNIPTIGVIDTDANPTWVTYPIPANDDSLRCINVIAGVLGRAGQEGQAARMARTKQGQPTHAHDHGLIAPVGGLEGMRRRDQQATPEEPDELEPDRLVTSFEPLKQSPALADAIDASLVEQMELSQYVDFEPEALEEIEELYAPENGPPSDAAELDSRIRATRAAAGLAYDREGDVGRLRVDRGTALRLEAEAQSMLDEPLTPEEAAALHARGAKGEHVQVQDTVKEAIERMQEAADPDLARRIAYKRRELGEELSEDDKAILNNRGVAQPARPAFNSQVREFLTSPKRKEENKGTGDEGKIEQNVDTTEQFNKERALLAVSAEAEAEDVRRVTAASGQVEQQRPPLATAEDKNAEDVGRAVDTSSQVEQQRTPLAGNEGEQKAEIERTVKTTEHAENERMPLTPGEQDKSRRGDKPE